MAERTVRNTRETEVANGVERNRFGTFGGVFTPTALTILGVILFMRSNFVLGHAGILNAFLILLVAKSITFFTALSISAISTNTQVQGGGAYFLISRSLGPEFGGAIGLTLFVAQALSVPFYILGFTEALVATFPAAQPLFLSICLVSAAILFAIAYIGAGWAIKVQYVVLAVLLLAIASFLIGAALNFDPALLQENMAPVSLDNITPLGFWIVFAIYFPAVTGIMTGVNMSGDLKDPSRSIPLGTLGALGLALLVYGLQIVLCGGAIPRADLIEAPYQSLVELSLFGAGFVITAGVFAATLSSAIGSFVAAPRVLQALARDAILKPTEIFATGTPKGDEPRRALWLTFAITIGVLVSVGGTGSEGLNTVAALVSMFFLAAYGVTNWAAFVEAVGSNPSFRPRFRFFRPFVALFGGLGCAAAALLVDPLAALLAVIVIASLYAYVRRRNLAVSFGDARRGFVYTKVRNNLIRLKEMPTDAKNWRPTVLVLTGNPETRLTLVRFALWLEAGRGIITIAQLLVGEFRDLLEERRDALGHLNEFIRKNRIPGFAEVAVVPEFDPGLRILLQAHSIGPIKPNLLLLGWSSDPVRAPAFVDHLRCAAELDTSMVIVADRGLPRSTRKSRVDVWWRGRENGSLMVVLAHLLVTNHKWKQSKIRILRLTRSDQERAVAVEQMNHLVEAARIPAEIDVLVSDRPFPEVLQAHSADATVVFLGFYTPTLKHAATFHDQYTSLLRGMPTTLLVHSSGEADLLA